MKCPLRFKELIEVEGVGRWRGADCLKKECAWWEEQTGHCSVRCLPTMLAGLAYHVKALIKTLGGKMPE
ncbi:hypothetical protein ES708_28216 [subsurface metagenome]